MDTAVLNNITYGMYIVTTKDNNKNVGCIINTVMQTNIKKSYNIYKFKQRKLYK